jgi:hypothetical protein
MRTLIWIIVSIFGIAIIREIARAIRHKIKADRYLALHPPAIEPEAIPEPPPAPIYNIQINHQFHEHNSYIIVTDPPKKSNKTAKSPLNNNPENSPDL